MDDRVLTGWLLDNGGPAIWYRTATELVDDLSGADLDRLTADPLASPLVHRWLDWIGLPGDLMSLHGADPGSFENVCAKLCDLGLHAGMDTPAGQKFDERMEPFLRRMAAGDDFTCKNVVAACLSWAGYGQEQAVSEFLSRRLEVLYQMAQGRNYDIYIDQDTFGDFPDAFRRKKLVNPELHDRLPGIWDIYALAHFPAHLDSLDTRHKIASVIDYILDPRYQVLDEGYGAMRTGKRRYFSMGWSVHLPGYAGFEFNDLRAGHFVQRVELMAHFPSACRHRWFQECLQHLKTYRTPQGTYRFPGCYLQERQQGYWVNGAYMRLEENRRLRQSLEVESTFRMCKIKKLAREE